MNGHLFSGKMFKAMANKLMDTIAFLAMDASLKPRCNYDKMVGDEMALANCKVVDVNQGLVLDNAFLHVRGGKIQSVQQGTPTKQGRLPTYDLGGRYLIPGLIDAHCHISVSSTFTILPTIGDAVRNYRQIRRQWATSIESGVTTVRDTGSFPLMRRRLEKEVENKQLKGPRVFHCNSMLNVKGSHPDIPPHHINPLARPASVVMGYIGADFRTDEELLRTLAENRRHASFIKLTVDRKSMLHGKGDLPVYTDRQLGMIFDFAQNHGLPVACHCATTWGLMRMLDYPVHSFEHVVSDTVLPDSVIQAMADRKISVVPTMSVGPAYVVNGVGEFIPKHRMNDFVEEEIARANAFHKNIPRRHCDPKIHEASLRRMALYGKKKPRHLVKKRVYLPEAANFVRILTTGAENLKKMKAAGVNIGCGMDAGMPLNYFGFLHREIQLLGRLSFSNLEALRTATVNNAAILGKPRNLGAIEAGKLADLVVLDKNPLEELSALQNPVMVIKAGVVAHETLAKENWRNHMMDSGKEIYS